MVFCASEMAVSNYKARLTIETKFRALKTDENEIKAHKITAMLFNFFYVHVREGGVFLNLH